MRLVVISGRSGSGKSTALNALEDMGFSCIDNLPVGLLPALFENQATSDKPLQLAVGIDARNILDDLEDFPEILARLKQSGVNYEVIFLDARTSSLIQRFSETRRKHPLSSDQLDLRQAIARERELLDPIISISNRVVDTSTMSLYQLRDLITSQISPDTRDDLSLLFQSFGFKRGVPIDADFVFDVRCLPNPYWEPELRNLTGNDQPVMDFLATQPDVKAMLDDIGRFLEHWLPHYRCNSRSYLTVAVGCTGGQHRSVYIGNKLREKFADFSSNVLVRHRELGGS